MVFWNQPSLHQPNTFKQLKAGLLLAPYKLGWQGFKRMMLVPNDKHQIPNTKAFQRFVLEFGIWNLEFNLNLCQ